MKDTEKLKRLQHDLERLNLNYPNFHKERIIRLKNLILRLKTKLYG